MTDTNEMILALQKIQANPENLRCVCDTGDNKWHSVADRSRVTFDANWMTVGVTNNRATIEAMSNPEYFPGFPESDFLLFACRRCGTVKAIKIQ